MTKNRLLGVIKSEGDTQQDLADTIGITLAQTNAKINGKSDFTATEIKAIKDRYNLSPEELNLIFFV